MASSNIEWTEVVWNPTTGCNKVSQGCKNCYAEKMHKRLMVMKPAKYSRPFLDGAFEYEPHLFEPLKWKKPRTIFVNSMSDLFHEDIKLAYIAKVYAVMFLTPQHTYQVLTKRPQRRYDVFKSPAFMEYLHQYCNKFHHEHIQKLEQELYFYNEVKCEFPFRNVWEGTSVEDQATANERIPILLQTPAAIRWISAEPLLGPVSLISLDAPENDDAGASRIDALTGDRTDMGRPCYATSKLDWVVVGGESGPKKRPFDLDWARSLRDQCKDTGTKFFMKQVDKVRPIPHTLQIREYPFNLSTIQND